MTGIKTLFIIIYLLAGSPKCVQSRKLIQQKGRLGFLLPFYLVLKLGWTHSVMYFQELIHDENVHLHKPFEGRDLKI